MSAEIFNCELNTVLEKFFEAPEPPQPPKDEAGEKSDEEDEKDEEEKDDKENTRSREPPAALGMNDFMPPYAGDDDPENDI